MLFRPHLGVGFAHYEDMPGASGSSRPAPGEVAALVERARRKDGAAFRELFHSHLEGVHRVVYRLVGPGPDVDDLVQTVFVEAFRSLPTFRGDALFSTWMARIAVRVTMHAVRRRPPRAASIDDEADVRSTAAGPERTAAAREALAILDGLLGELRPKRRAAFVLHVLEGYAVEEVAAILNASTAAVKVRVHDARRHIERRCRRHPGLVELLAERGGP
jgi:RNA polymerase sigma-70 factor, ECF subfamily